MNGATREQVMDALLTRLEFVCGNTFNGYSRYFIAWEDVLQALKANGVNAPDMPALFLYDGGLNSDDWSRSGKGIPATRTMNRNIVIYARKPGADTPSGPDQTPGGSILHPLIEAVEAAFEPDNKVVNELTLGGLVHKCWIEGTGAMIAGDIDKATGLCMQTIPVRIMLP